jgi:ABC-2 type transport system permease protein
MARVKTKKLLSTGRALRRLGFRQSLRSALIIGLLVGLMMGAQGAAYAAAFPDQKARHALVASLESAPALGFMAGEIRDAATPASYSIYKSIALVTLMTGIWGILVTTRLLRGQEEDGRLEALLAGRTTKAAAGAQMLIGFGYSIIIAFLIAWALIGALGASPQVGMDAGQALLLTLGVFLPGIFFSSLGVLTSQLTLTRGRAMAYSLVPLLVFFVIRGAANSISDWNDLKRFTPFGWTDLLNPILDPQTGWIYPTLIFAIITIPLGLYLAKRRDLGQSLLPQSTSARSRRYLLGSDLGLAIRQNIGTFLAWGVGTLLFSGLLAAMAKLGADLLNESPAASKIIGSLGGDGTDIVVAFIGFGGLFTALILLVMTAVYMGSVRQQEAKGYLDNILIQPVSRGAWLAKRLLVIVVMSGAISLLSGYLIWIISGMQNVSLDLGIITQNATALTGTLFLLIGIGTFFYGLLPRFAVVSMYIVIVWAFVVDVLKAFFSLDDAIDKTSVLHYVSFAPSVAPDWKQFAWLVGIGLVLMALGVWRFTQRDIVNE